MSRPAETIRRRDGRIRIIPVKPQNVVLAELWWQREGLSYTNSGYGRAIPTAWKVKLHDGRWRRVYASVYGNNGSTWIVWHGKCLVVDVPH